MLAENARKRSFSYENALYDVCPIPFYGKYNDYGAVEDCEGFGLNIVLEAIKDQLYEFGQGPNSCHDCAVNKDIFDLELMFEADHEDRLAIQNHSFWDGDSYDHQELERERAENGITASQQFELDRLAAKIKKIDTHRLVTHVIIHGDVFDAILNEYYHENYVGAGEGDAGYNNSYKHVYFKDVIATIPEYIERWKKAAAENKGKHAYLLRSPFNWRDECLAGRYIEGCRGGSEMSFAIVDVHSTIMEDYVSKEDWEGLAAFAKEAITGYWIHRYMASTRKLWTKQSGAGSQNNDTRGYKLLANTVLKIAQAEESEDEECDD